MIGGGYGGATCAKYIRMWSERRIEVLLIERERAVRLLPAVEPRARRLAPASSDLTHRLREAARVRRAGVRDEVTEIIVEKKRVRLQRIEDLPYDRLVVSPGIDFMYDQIPGLNNAEAQKTVLHAWKAGPETVALRKQLEAMRDGGVYILSMPKAPFRCPPGPYERACQVAHYFKQAKPRSKVLVLDGNADIVSKKGLFKAAWNELYKGIIEYRPNQEAKDVDVEGDDGQDRVRRVKGDVLNVVPPHGAGDHRAPGEADHRRTTAGATSTGGRWSRSRWQGCTCSATPRCRRRRCRSRPAWPTTTPRSPPSAIVATMTGQPLNPTPTIINTCYSFVSRQRGDARRLGAPMGPGQEGAGAGARLGRRFGRAQRAGEAVRRAWARNIWADTLA